MKWSRFLLIAAVLTAMRCSLQTAAGGDVTDTGNAAVASTILNSDGTRAVYAKVSLRPADYLTQQKPGPNPVSRMRDVYTDTAGFFFIDSLDTGLFFIEVNNGRSEAILIRYENYQPDARHMLEPQVLAPVATLSGKVDPQDISGNQAFVKIYGLERMVGIDPLMGTYSVQVPAGEYTIQIAFGSAAATTIKGITAGAGEVSHVEAGGVRYRTRPLYLNTTETGAYITEDVYRFPLLIRLNRRNFDFSSIGANGGEIHFQKSDGAVLPHEIELWDPARGEAVLWVLMDTVRANFDAQFLTMRWGDPQHQSVSSGPEVFSPENGFIGVWHLDSEAADTGTADVYINSTGIAAHGIDRVSATGKEGIIGRGQQFNGAGDYIDCGNHESLSLVDNFTISAWVKLADTATDKYHRIISKKEPWYGSEGYELEANPAIQGFDPEMRSGELTFVGADSGLFRSYIDWDGNWHHCVAVVSEGSVTLYFDGQSLRPYGIGRKGPLLAGDQNLLIGGIGDNDFLNGWIDEVRIENVARSTSWIRLCYENQRTNGRLLRMR